MQESLFVYKNGEAVALRPKPFCFELAMEGYIADNPQILSNYQLDLTNPEVKALELPLDSKHRIDIMMQYANDTSAIIELKNIVVDDGAHQQLLNYLQIKRQKMAKEYGEYADKLQLIGILVGPAFDDQVIKQIEHCTRKQDLIYGVELQRYFDNGNWYVFAKWYVPCRIMNERKDYTKYILNDKTNLQLGKGRLVYEVVKDYLDKNPGIGFAKLRRGFPDSLRNRKSSRAKHHVVEMESNVLPDDRFTRYFKEPLMCADGAFVVSSQWGIGNIKPFIEYAKKLGYKIEEVTNH